MRALRHAESHFIDLQKAAASQEKLLQYAATSVKRLQTTRGVKALTSISRDLYLL